MQGQAPNRADMAVNAEAQDEGPANAGQAAAEAPQRERQPDTSMPCTRADLQTMDTMYGNIDIVPETQEDV